MKKNETYIAICLLLATAGRICAADPNATKTKETNKFDSFFPDQKLEEAIQNVDANGVRNALTAGANPNWVSDTPRKLSALNSVTMFWSFWSPNFDDGEKRCIEILTLLFEAGAKIQPCDRDIMFSPISSGLANVVKLLLDKGASPTTEIGGLTPVEWAEKYGHPDIVDILVKHGGKPILPKEAAQLRLTNFAGKGDFIKMEKAVRDGAYVNSADKHGETALNAAVGGTSFDCERYLIVFYLLQKGANPNLQDRATFGMPLHTLMAMTSFTFRSAHRSENVSAKRLQSEAEWARLTIEMLLKAGALVSARGEDGQTPLHIAVKCNNLIGASMLIEAGAKIADKDNTGKTPLDYAESAEMIKLLKSHGAKEQ